MRGAPITKLLSVLCVSLTFLGETVFPRIADRLILSRAASVLKHGEVWRLFTSSLFLCDGLVTALVSAGLLYSLRLFERQMGSSKFAAFIFVGTGLDAASRLAYLTIPGLGLRGVASGPFHIIFSLLPLYFREYFPPKTVRSRSALFQPR